MTTTTTNHHCHRPLLLLFFLRFVVRWTLFFLPGAENQQNSFHRTRFDTETEYEPGRTELEVILFLSHGCFGGRPSLRLSLRLRLLFWWLQLLPV
jgi:hypothetical protein